MIEQAKVEDLNVSLISKDANIKFTLYFTENTARNILDFCESYIITLDDFSAKTIISYLGAIEDDIHSKAFSLIGSYYDNSKLMGNQTRDNPKEDIEKPNTIEVDFPLELSEVVEIICDEFPCTPEEFIENTMSWKIESIIENIKKGNYEFLGTYKNFLRVFEAIERLIEEI
ncbi:MAG: hypothetical protein ACTSRT_20080 [Promethearchaeota archaeon]